MIIINMNIIIIVSQLQLYLLNLKCKEKCHTDWKKNIRDTAYKLTIIEHITTWGMIYNVTTMIYKCDTYLLNLNR